MTSNGTTAHPLHGVEPERMKRAQTEALSTWAQMRALGLTTTDALALAVQTAASVIHPHGFIIIPEPTFEIDVETGVCLAPEPTAPKG